VKEKVKGQLVIAIELECPYCYTTLDVFNDHETGFCNDEGEAWSIIETFGRGDGWKNLDETLTCGECEKEFIWDELEY